MARASSGMLGLIVFVAALILLTRGVISIATRNADEPVFAPITVGKLHVYPDPVVIGEPATLSNGICSSWPETLPSLIYLRLEEADREGLINAGRVYNLYQGRPDLVDGQRRDDIEPGCTPDEFQIPAVPDTIPVGRWVLKVTITVMPSSGASPQRVVEQSEPFDVIAAPVQQITQ